VVFPAEPPSCQVTLVFHLTPCVPCRGEQRGSQFRHGIGHFFLVAVALLEWTMAFRSSFVMSRDLAGVVSTLWLSGAQPCKETVRASKSSTVTSDHWRLSTLVSPERPIPNLRIFGNKGLCLPALSSIATTRLVLLGSIVQSQGESRHAR